MNERLLALEQDCDGFIILQSTLLPDLELDEGHDRVESVFPFGLHLLHVSHPCIPASDCVIQSYDHEETADQAKHLRSVRMIN
jgi:hypothetical protein